MSENQFRNMDTKKKSIMKINFCSETDEIPDLSYLGKYQSNPGPDDRTIDRAERVDQLRMQHRYFVACYSGEETGNPNSIEEAYHRMESLERGDLQMLYLYASAKIAVDGVIQTVRSSGLGGVESDSEPSYLAEIKKEELTGLKSILMNLGFPETEIDKAIEECEDSET